MRTTFFTLLIAVLTPFLSESQTHSAARKWNNLVLEAIRNDFARPTVHARNLYHHSIICYDAWAAFNPSKQLYFLGQTHYGYTCQYDTIAIPGNIEDAREIAISYASYRFLQNRYANSPDYNATLALANQLMNEYGLDPSYTSTDYMNEGPAALGNYLAQQIQLYGLTDGSNEANDFANTFYTQLNPPLEMSQPGNPDIQDPNHWQPLSLEVLIDQSGNLITTTQPHLSPEWGNVYPFALDTAMATSQTRDGMTFNVYFDTMQPAYLYEGDSAAWESFYKWNHTLVSVWQSHLDPNDGVLWDISPASIGNNTWYPNPNDSSTFAPFYDLVNGGDPGTGYTVNPKTGLPYTPQIVHRADYARVLAEFWADGIDSETPPGHWFEIYHYVSDQPTFERKWNGVGPVLDPLEYDVKAQLTLGGTMHDAAIAAWGLKGYYDYLRPVSAIRFMAEMGQSSDTNELNYHPDGIPLLPGFVEVVHIGDTLAGQWNENVGKIKLYTWRGHEYINDPLVDLAGVGWILAEEWWPYQRPTFVTPPFAGFVSGHSTFSRAAAHTMELITGDPFFPGGMGEFLAPQNEFLKFEEGPSDTIVLQWATYRDASDQCSLSRIWGGIHPPIDDIPGRMMGDVIGPMGFQHADSIFAINQAALTFATSSDSLINIADIGSNWQLHFGFSTTMDTSVVPSLAFNTSNLTLAASVLNYYWVDSTEVVFNLEALPSSLEIDTTSIELSNLVASNTAPLPNYTFKNLFIVDTRKPLLNSALSNVSLLNDGFVGQALEVTLIFDESCDTSITPSIDFIAPTYINPTLTLIGGTEQWLNDTTFEVHYNLADFDETIGTLDLSIQLGTDAHDNQMDSMGVVAPFEIDTENPNIVGAVSSVALISQANLSSPQFTVTTTFDQKMDTTVLPMVSCMDQGSVFSTLTQNSSQTFWLDEFTLETEFFIFSSNNDRLPLDVTYDFITDENGNELINPLAANVFESDMKSPEVIGAAASSSVISDSEVGANLYYIDISFSEPMDTMITPFVVLQAIPSITSEVQYNVPLSMFLDSLTFRAYFQVFDAGSEVAPVDLSVDFGEDFAGNPQLQTDIFSFTTLDTKNPTVISLTANNYVLNQWGQSFDVVAVFDEPMQTSVHPSLGISPTPPVSLPKVDSSWLNNNTYQFQYELLGVPAQTTIFDITLANALDLAGNVQVVTDENAFFQIDQLLGIDALHNGTALLYPTVIENGGTLTLVNLPEENDTYSFKIINGIGQQVDTLLFEKNGAKWQSQGVDLSTGLYYLTSKELQFKIVVK